jgi:hypothetical protein
MKSAIQIVLGLILLFLPQLVALVAMRPTGRGWARTRIISYSVCALLYFGNAIMVIAEGGQPRAIVQFYFAFLFGRAADRAYQAWKQGDYRPAHLRDRKAPLADAVASAQGISSVTL